MKSYREELRSALEYAPKDVGVPDTSPVAWESVSDLVCARCSMRLIARGCTHLIQGFAPTYADQVPSNGLRACSGCGGRYSNAKDPWQVVGDMCRKLDRETEGEVRK